MAISHKYPLEVYYVDNACRGNKAELYERGGRGGEKKRADELFLLLPARRISDVYLRCPSHGPSIFPARAPPSDDATERGARRTRGMRSVSDGDGHNPFILQNAIIAGRAGARARTAWMAIVRITMPPPDDECY